MTEKEIRERYLMEKLDEELSEIVDGFNVNYGIQKVDLENMTVTVEFTLNEYEGNYSLTYF